MAKAFVPYKLDKVRNLRYGMRAFSKIEDEFGTPLAKIDLNNLTQRQLATIIWAGFEHEDKNLDADKVMDLIDEYSDIQEASEMLSKAIKESMGKPRMTTPAKSGKK